MKKNILPIIIISTLLFSQSCSNSNANNNTTSKNIESVQNTSSSDISSTEKKENSLISQYRKITPKEAEDMMKSGNNYILLDVRTEEEYKEKRIDGAILIPDTEIVAKATSELPDKDALILVYCRSGRRSEKSSRELIDLGYTNVYDFGGLNDWPYETVSN